MLFKAVHGAQCVLKAKGGVYHQVDVYVYGRGRLFAKKGGFIGLRANGMTTAPNLTWELLDGVSYQIGDGTTWGALVMVEEDKAASA